MLRNMLGHHGFWGLHGSSQLGAFLINANQSTNPGSMTPTEGACSPDGMFVWHGSGWNRRAVGAPPCTIVAGTNPTITTHNADGSVDITNPDGSKTHVAAPLSCQLAPSTGVIVVGGIALAPTPDTPVSYSWGCKDAAIPQLTRVQQQQISKWMSDAQKAAFAGAGGGSAFNTPGAGQTAADAAYRGIINGTWPLTVFDNAADKDQKKVLVTWDDVNAAVPVLTFTWTHNPTVFQTIDNFITSISPWDPSSTLCSLLPVASTVPNPYVAAGSIVLKLSGKCDSGCPQGMLHDAATQTCACPPGYLYNITSKICMSVVPPANTSTPIPTWMIVGGVVLGLGLMALVFGKSEHAPA